MVTRSMPGVKRYPSSQQEIDDILRNELKNIRFSAKVIYNPKLRLLGKTTATIQGKISVRNIKIEVGKQAKPGRKELIETLLHEELEARIILRVYNLFGKNPKAKKC